MFFQRTKSTAIIRRHNISSCWKYLANLYFRSALFSNSADAGEWTVCGNISDDWMKGKTAKTKMSEIISKPRIQIQGVGGRVVLSCLWLVEKSVETAVRLPLHSLRKGKEGEFWPLVGWATSRDHIRGFGVVESLNSNFPAMIEGVLL